MLRSSSAQFSALCSGFPVLAALALQGCTMYVPVQPLPEANDKSKAETVDTTGTTSVATSAPVEEPPAPASSTSDTSTSGSTATTELDIAANPNCSQEELELSIECVYDYAIQQRISSIDELLTHLPISMRQNYTLMEDSRSRHTSDTAHPRLIMYGLDVRFIMGVSGQPDDPLYNMMEIAELDAKTGHWQFREIDFTAETPQLSETDEDCQGCHGSPARPIWGEYPDWPGAFGSEDNFLTKPQQKFFYPFYKEENTNPRYAHLDIPPEYTIRENASFYLDGRLYGYANTVFNFELGFSAADGLITRIKNHELWNEKKRLTLIDSEYCGSYTGVNIVYKELGLDGANDFQLHKPFLETEDSSFGWNQGNASLSDIIIFKFLTELARSEKSVKKTLKKEMPVLDYVVDYWFDLRGEARSEWLANDAYGEDGDFTLQTLTANLNDNEALCKAIAKLRAEE